jgi:hypothetical protein
MPSAVVVVAQADDALAVDVRQAIDRLGGAVTWYRPPELALLGVDLNAQAFHVEGRSVRAVLWRVSPEMPLAEGFRADDRAFVGAEVAATWIAALRTPGISAINRFDADAWYSGLRPHYWRNRLAAAGIAVTTMHVGGDPVPDDWQWSPYTTGEASPPPDPKARAMMASACHPVPQLVTSAALRGRIAGGSRESNVARAAALLDTWGVGLAAIDSDPRGRVHRIRVLPVFDSPSVRERVTSRIGRYLYDDCTARRS